MRGGLGGGGKKTGSFATCWGRLAQPPRNQRARISAGIVIPPAPPEAKNPCRFFPVIPHLSLLRPCSSSPFTQLATYDRLPHHLLPPSVPSLESRLAMFRQLFVMTGQAEGATGLAYPQYRIPVDIPDREGVVHVVAGRALHLVVVQHHCRDRSLLGLRSRPDRHGLGRRIEQGAGGRRERGVEGERDRVVVRQIRRSRTDGVIAGQERGSRRAAEA